MSDLLLPAKQRTPLFACPCWRTTKTRHVSFAEPIENCDVDAMEEVPTIPNNNNNEIFQESFQSFDEYYYYYQLPKKSHTKLEVILRFFMVLFQWVRDQQQERIQQETDMAL